MKPRFFASPTTFRAWLAKNHHKADELLVGFYRKDSGKASITWPESVDQALCFGWIDGVRRRLDDTSYTIRFTPRRPSSIWSAVNIRRVALLTEQGLMSPTGLAAFERRSEEKSRIYAYEQRYNAILPPEYERKFRANRKAWTFFQAQAPSYRRVMTYRIVSAKKDDTRVKRLDALIRSSAEQRRVL